MVVALTPSAVALEVRVEWLVTVVFGYIVIYGTISTTLVAVCTSWGYDRVVLASTSNIHRVHVLLIGGLTGFIGKMENEAGKSER